MSIWPSSISTDANLYVAVDFPNSVTALNGSLNSTDTVINVSSTANYPSSGGFILIDSELIKFTGISGNQLTGCSRGVDGTAPASHINNAVVNMVSMSEHHNVLKDEIIALETSLNLTANKALISNASGRVDVSSTTNTELGFVSGVVSSIQTQLNGKQASLGYTPVNKAGDSMSGNLTLLGQHALLFQDTGTNTVTIEAPNTISASYVVKLPMSQGGASTFLQNDGSGNVSWGTSSTPPAGSSGDLQYNNSGVLGGAANVTTDGNNLTVGGTFTLGGSAVSQDGFTTYFDRTGVDIGIIGGFNTGSLPHTLAAAVDGDFDFLISGSLVDTKILNTANGGYILIHPNGTESAITNSAILQIDATSHGFLEPRLTTTQRNAISSPAAGLSVYDTTLNDLYVYNGTSWAGIAQNTVTTIVGANPITPDASVANTIIVTVGTATVINGPTNGYDGQKLTFRLVQDVTGHTVTFSTGSGNFRFGTDITSFTASAANKTDYVGVIWTSSANVWDIVSIIQGY
jgi:hypothetical protein